MTWLDRNVTELGGRRLAPETLMMGYGYFPGLSEGSVKCPLFQTSTFVFRSAAEGKRFFELAYGLREPAPRERQGLIYSRINNPNLEILEDRLGIWEDSRALVFGSGESIWFARSTDDGRSFSAPAKVAVLPKLMLGRHRGPRIVISGNTIIVSAIAADGDLHSWRSTDAGRTWSKPVIVDDQSTATREGLHAMAADAALLSA